MAETSGFQTDLPQSAYLSLSIGRAISLAQQRSHRYVTLEHLLFCLLDDPNTTEILESLGADIVGIRGNIAEVVNRGLTALYTPGEFDLHASYKVERVLQTASDDADRLNCEEVDAAFVIAALSRESDNHATGILKRNGVAYSSAVSWLYANRGASTPSSHHKNRSAPSSTEDTLGVPPSPPPSKSPPPRFPQQSAPPPRAPISAAPATDRYSPIQRAEPAMQQAEIAMAEHPSPGEVHFEERAAAETAEDQILELEIDALEAGGNDQPPVSQPNAGAASQIEVERRVPPEAELPAGFRRDGRANGPAARERYAGSSPREYPAPPAPANAAEKNAGPVQGPNGAYSNYRGVESASAPTPPPPGPSQQTAGFDDATVPPSSRLDEMRLNKARAGRLPVPAQAKSPPQKSRRSRALSGPAPQPAGVASGKSVPAKRPRRQSRPHEIFAGRLAENIPRKMRAAVAERVEVRISREETQTFLRGLEGRGEAVTHDLSITQTMSVALRAPDGGFMIEPLSPETQWIFNRPDESDVYGRWRWVITPQKRGTRKLQLLIASRSIGSNGIVADSALPDQAVTIRVQTNYWLSFARGLQWIAAMVVGGVLTEFAMIGSRLFGQ